MLSHAAVISEVAGLHAFLKQIGEGTSVTEEDVVLSYLPLAHIFDRRALVICSCPVLGYLKQHSSLNACSIRLQEALFPPSEWTTASAALTALHAGHVAMQDDQRGIGGYLDGFLGHRADFSCLHESAGLRRRCSCRWEPE